MSEQHRCPVSMRMRKTRFSQVSTESFDWDKLVRALYRSSDARDRFGKLADIARPPVAGAAARYHEVHSRHAECFTRLLDDAAVAGGLTGSISPGANLDDNWLQVMSGAADATSFARCQALEALVIAAYEDVLEANPPPEVADKVGFLLRELQLLLTDKDHECNRLLSTTGAQS